MILVTSFLKIGASLSDDPNISNLEAFQVSSSNLLLDRKEFSFDSDDPRFRVTDLKESKLIFRFNLPLIIE